MPSTGCAGNAWDGEPPTGHVTTPSFSYSSPSHAARIARATYTQDEKNTASTTRGTPVCYPGHEPMKPHHQAAHTATTGADSATQQRCRDWPYGNGQQSMQSAPTTSLALRTPHGSPRKRGAPTPMALPPPIHVVQRRDDHPPSSPGHDWDHHQHHPHVTSTAHTSPVPVPHASASWHSQQSCTATIPPPPNPHLLAPLAPWRLPLPPPHTCSRTPANLTH